MLICYHLYHPPNAIFSLAHEHEHAMIASDHSREGPARSMADIIGANALIQLITFEGESKILLQTSYVSSRYDVMAYTFSLIHYLIAFIRLLSTFYFLLFNVKRLMFNA